MRSTVRKLNHNSTVSVMIMIVTITKILTSLSGILFDITQPATMEVRYVQQRATFALLYPPEKI